MFAFFEFEEVYSIVCVIKKCTVLCQTTFEPTAEGGLQSIVLFLTDALEPTKALRVRHVPVTCNQDAGAPSYTDRPHDQLTATGRQIRETSNTALAERFLPRNGGGLQDRSHLFDHVMVPSLKMHQVKYVDVQLSSIAGKAAGLLPNA